MTAMVARRLQVFLVKIQMQNQWPATCVEELRRQLDLEEGVSRKMYQYKAETATDIAVLIRKREKLRLDPYPSSYPWLWNRLKYLRKQLLILVEFLVWQFFLFVDAEKAIEKAQMPLTKKPPRPRTRAAIDIEADGDT